MNMRKSFAAWLVALFALVMCHIAVAGIPPITAIPVTSSTISNAGGELTANANNKIIISRIRAAYQASRANNLYSNSQLKAPPAYANSTAIAKGQMIAANGNWYACVNGGTTAATGTGPSATFVNGGGYMTDGTAWFTYFGPARVMADDASAPAVTQYCSNPNFGVTITHKAYPGSFAVYGVQKPYSYDPNRLVLNGFNWKAATPNPAAGRRIDFYSDGANVMIDASGSNSSSFIRIAVDQFDGKGLRFVTPGSLLLSQPYVKLAWGSATKRHYIVFFSTGNYDVFNGVQIDNGATVWAPNQSTAIHAVTMSDSTFQGSGYGPVLPGNDVPNRIAIILGIDDVHDFSIPGGGELNPGASSYYVFSQRLPEALSYNPQLWIIMGSVNDRTGNGYTSAALTAQVTATLQAIRSAGNTAPIIRGGAWPLLDNSDVTTTETSIKAGYDAWAANDPYPHGFVYVSGATPPYITRAYNNNGGALMQNVSQYEGSDGHPIDWGTAHYADRLIEDIITSLTTTGPISANDNNPKRLFNPGADPIAHAA